MTLVGIITLLIVGITLLITLIIPTLIYLLAGKNVFQFCGLFTIIGGVGLLFAPANILRLVLLTRAIKGVGASLPDLHQVPLNDRRFQGDSRRDRSTQTGDHLCTTRGRRTSSPPTSRCEANRNTSPSSSPTRRSRADAMIR